MPLNWFKEIQLTHNTYMYMYRHTYIHIQLSIHNNNNNDWWVERHSAALTFDPVTGGVMSFMVTGRNKGLKGQQKPTHMIAAHS